MGLLDLLIYLHQPKNFLPQKNFDILYDEIKLIEGIITLSPFLRPIALRAKKIAEVPLLHTTAKLDLTKSLILFSKNLPLDLLLQDFFSML